MSKKVDKITTSKNLNTIKVSLLILMVSFLLYGLSINNNYNIDDDYVTENHQLVQKGIKGIPEIFSTRYNTKDEQYFGYRPLTIAIFAVEYEFFGNNPHSAHFFNIIYYAIACILLFKFLILILKDKYPENYMLISIIISLIFASHAIHSEAVLSLKNREEILSFIFAILATMFAFNYYSEKKILDIVLSIFLLILAFLTKESTVIFIILIPFTLVFFKTDLKILPNLKLPKFSHNKTFNNLIIIIFSTLILLLILCKQEFRLGFGHYLHLHNTGFHFKTGIIWLVFFFLVFTLIILNHKTLLKLSLKNIILLSIFIIFFGLSKFGKIQFFGLLSMFTMFYFLNLQNNNTENLKKLKLIDTSSKKFIIPIFIFTILAGLIIFITYYIPKQSLPEVNAPVFKWQNPIFGYGANFFDKVALALYSLIYYFKLLIIPYPLRYYYGYKMIPEVTIVNPIVLFSLILNLVLLFWSLRNFNNRKLISFGYLFLFISIFPVSNTFFPLTGIIAERLLFTPSLGFAIIISCLIFKIAKLDLQKHVNKASRNVIIALTLIIVLPNSILSISRNKDWKDRKTLFAHDIKYLENSAKANNTYANYLIGEVYTAIKNNQPISNYKTQVETAIYYFQHAIDIDSTYSNPWHNLAYINMVLYKNFKDAEYQFTKSIQCDPTVAAVYLNRGTVNYHLGNYEQSILDITEYLTKFHNYKNKELDKAYLFRAKSYFELKDTVNSTKDYKTALENLKHENITAAVLDDITNYFVSIKDYKHAINAVDIKINLQPNVDVHYVDKGNYCLLNGDTIKAIENWELAFEKYKGNFNIAMTLSSYFKENNQPEKAEYYYSEAIKFRKNKP